MKRLSGQDLEAIIYELLVFGECCPFEDYVAAISLIAKQRVFYILEMYPDLMCPAGFELTVD